MADIRHLLESDSTVVDADWLRWEIVFFNQSQGMIERVYVLERYKNPIEVDTPINQTEDMPSVLPENGVNEVEDDEDEEIPEALREDDSEDIQPEGTTL
jgi:hypothetical protein